MKPGDIVMYRDERFGRHRFWEIEGIYLGGEGQEGLVELRGLNYTPGVSPSRTHTTTFVPEPMLRALAIYTPDIRP